MADTTRPPSGRWRRLAWFAGLWLAGVAAVAALSYLLRWWMFAG
jgi:hypothetical protein